MKLSRQRFILPFLCLCALLVACEDVPAIVSPPARQVVLVVDSQRLPLETEAATVRELLTEADVSLGNLDRVTPAETTFLASGMTVTVTRVLQEIATYTQTLPFQRQIVRDATLPAGESCLLQSGEPGLLERRYRVTLEDGEETERLLLTESVVQEPRDEVRVLGTRPEIQLFNVTGTIVYLSNQDAWLMQYTNRERRRLSAFGDLDGRVFALSPDGSRLMFTRAVSQSAGTEEEIDFNELWVVRTTEADPNALALNVQNVLWAAWAPDSETIAWTTAEATERPPGWRGLNDLWRATVTARNVLVSRRQLLEPEAGGGYGWWGTRYAWSPDGETLAYSRPESIGMVALAQPELRPLLRFPAFRSYSSWAWNPGLAWSAEGDMLVTVNHVPPPALGPAPQPASGTPVPGTAPAAGDSQASQAEESPIFDLWAVVPEATPDATATYSAELASEVGMWAAPAFSPDGQSVLFGRALVPYQSATSAYTLCLIDRDGSNQSCLAEEENAPPITTPEWHWLPTPLSGPDGPNSNGETFTVAFLRQGDIYLVAMPHGTPVQLTDEGNISRFVWTQ